MSLEALVDTAVAHGAIIDERVEFQDTSEAGISAFLKPNSPTSNPVIIEIPNSMIIKPEDAYKAFDINAKNMKDDEIAIFKIYIAGLLSGKLEDKNFSTYIRLLPHPSEIGSPLTMTDDQLELFNETSLQKKFIEERKSLLKDQFDSVCHLNEGITFNDFLWAHLIITSRSFPYRIVNPDAKPNLVMLLPIIDLLNHKPNSKVEWSSESSGNFKLSAIQPTFSEDSNRVEVFNNYGPKGNAELFLGYGFVLEDNEYETLQLSLSLPQSLKNDIQSKWNISLPTIDDYTYNFDQKSSSNEKNTESKELNKSTVFMLNKFHPIATGLLEVFSFICKNEGDEGPTLKNTMNGLNKLKQSLEVKFSNKLEKLPAFDSTKVSKSIYNKAATFRKGQLKVYNMAKNEVKSREKHLLKEYRKYFITVKDIIQKDRDEFGNFLDIMQWNKDISDLNKMDMELLLRLWLLKTINYHKKDDFNNLKFNMKWAFDLFEQKVQSPNVKDDDGYMTDLYYQIIPQIKENVPELVKNEFWELNHWLIVDNIVTQNSYEKGKSLEPLLIHPLNLF